VCYILCMCVCVGVSDMSGTFLGGSQGGLGMPPPPSYVQRSTPSSSPGPMGFRATPRNFCFGWFLLFLADL
jgi:hypothetical protein